MVYKILNIPKVTGPLDFFKGKLCMPPEILTQITELTFGPTYNIDFQLLSSSFVTQTNPQTKK